MNTLGRVGIATVSVLLFPAAGAQAQRLPPDVVVSNTRVYDVTISTTFVVPRTGNTLSGLGVWHALPNDRP